MLNSESAAAPAAAAAETLGSPPVKLLRERSRTRSPPTESSGAETGPDRPFPARSRGVRFPEVPRRAGSVPLTAAEVRSSTASGGGRTEPNHAGIWPPSANPDALKHSSPAPAAPARHAGYTARPDPGYHQRQE